MEVIRGSLMSVIPSVSVIMSLAVLRLIHLRDRFLSHTSMDYTRRPTKYDTEAITVKVGFEF